MSFEQLKPQKMKVTELIRTLAFLSVVIALTSCDKRVVTETAVADDGSIDRTIVYEQDTSAIVENIFGIGSNNGWTANIERVEELPNDQVKRTNNNATYRVTMKKHYSSVTEANNELNANSPSRFRIESSYEKNFRWFYTYTQYADTYKALNRFENFPRDSFFTKEDLSFIDRLPSEGHHISKADSIYLDHLTEKVGTYFTVALYEKHFDLAVKAAREAKLEQRWIDSLQQYKGAMYSKIMKDEFEPENEQAFMIPLINSMNIGFPTAALQDSYLKAANDMQPVINFMTAVAGEMHFQHRIHMPGEIVDSNADSLRGSTVVWNPMTIKFMLNDFTMKAESRTINYWAILVTAVVIGITAWLWSRNKRLQFS
jgi:hypothetical protein